MNLTSPKKHQRVNVLNDQMSMEFEECEAQDIHVQTLMDRVCTANAIILWSISPPDMKGHQYITA